MPLYDEKEVNQFVYLLFEHLLNYSKIDIHLNQNEIIHDNTFQQVISVVEELKKYKPFQYVLGKTFFYDLPFMVNENVLIPRQETEELVKWILDDQKEKPVHVLDIGTGSGCIAIALAKFLKASTIYSGDISKEALEVAKQNAKINQADVNFFEFDVFNPPDLKRSFDIIVSNPPYVCGSEKTLMSKNVLEYEPELALFVSDEDPLIFYKAIAKYGLLILKEEGRIYFEINENFGDAMVELLITFGYKDIELRKDINGKQRMIKGTKI